MLYASLADAFGAKLGRLCIQNDGSGDEDFGNYRGWLEDEVTGKRAGQIVCVNNYRREDGPWTLVRRVLEEMALAPSGECRGH